MIMTVNANWVFHNKHISTYHGPPCFASLLKSQEQRYISATEYQTMLSIHIDKRSSMKI